jgi:hypothetical protein
MDILRRKYKEPFTFTNPNQAGEYLPGVSRKTLITGVFNALNITTTLLSIASVSSEKEGSGFVLQIIRI